ncbi:type II toxin-antitoxin system VapC family toxin [Candidatus Palauibacter sp.]|uniref:type II toxin-antitoxin system VapC family toxin n=1 Tax=Candidatus Palauibacter sp. TaxID=3101350 RepID=UPI003C70410C
MIADTSAWVEYLRDTGSPTHLALRSRVQSGEAIATPAPVLLELLAGCGTEREAAAVARLLARFEILGTGGLADFEDAALIHRTLRRQGLTIRSVLDCMVAAASLRMGRPLLARDRDYDMIARHFELDLVRP